MDLKISNVALFTELALIGTGALNGRGDKISFRPAYFNWSFPHFRLTPFVCHVLGKTNSSFWKPSVVCCEDGSTNTVMTDTNNGRLMMTTNTLALYQNVPGESVESVNGV